MPQPLKDLVSIDCSLARTMLVNTAHCKVPVTGVSDRKSNQIMIILLTDLEVIDWGKRVIKKDNLES